jgi:hypothetical protein
MWYREQFVSKIWFDFNLIKQEHEKAMADLF